ncbi:TPA: ABC transporter permease [Escherichia coli]
MNDSTKKKSDFLDFFQVMYKHRELFLSLAKRDIFSKYQGSFIGVFWSLITPVVMLAVYTFVFSVVFKARWLGGTDSKTEFALVLFSGLIVYNLFSECINRSPALIISNANFVKKVIFPLEILPPVILLSSLFNFVSGLIVWVAFYIIVFGYVNVSILFVPIAIMPLLFIILGVSFFLASLGTYLRDINQVVVLITTMMMFLSPIFYPVSSLPTDYQLIMKVNPLTFIVEQVRGLMISGVGINWSEWSGWLIFSIFLFYLGYFWFKKTRDGFADVI